LFSIAAMYASVVYGINKNPRIGQRIVSNAAPNQVVKIAMTIITSRGKKTAKIGIRQGIGGSISDDEGRWFNSFLISSLRLRVSVLDNAPKNRGPRNWPTFPSAEV